MDLPTLKVERLYRQIANLLVGLIRQGRFCPGQMLPPERDLARQLGVSRSSVREALIALEIGGWVEIRTGSGVYVRAELPAETEIPATEDIGVEQVMAAREVVEGEIAALAARNATDAQLAEMAALIAAMETEITDMAAFHVHDRRFHLLVGAMTGNPVFVEVVDLMWKKRASAFYRTFESKYSDQAVTEAMERDHRNLFDVLNRRDARAARTAMQRHIRNACVKLFARSPGPPAPGSAS